MIHCPRHTPPDDSTRQGPAERPRPQCRVRDHEEHASSHLRHHILHAGNQQPWPHCAACCFWPRTPITGGDSDGDEHGQTGSKTMLDSNFLKENNARQFWQPMGIPAESIDNPPAIIVSASGNLIRDIDGKEVIDAVGGLWNVNLGFSCEPVKQAITDQLARLPYYSAFRGTSNDRAIETGLPADRVLLRGGDGPRLLHLRRVGQRRDCPPPRQAVPPRQGRGRPYQVHQPAQRLSRHAFRRRQREWQCQVPGAVRTALARLFSHPGTKYLQEPVRRVRSGKTGAALRQGPGERDRIPAPLDHRRLHHGAGARCRRGHRST